MHLQVKDILFLQNRVAYMRDEQAYKKLYFHFYTPLHRFSYSLVKNYETAEEIVSDTMMKIWDMGNKIASIDKLDAYLFTSVKNACLTYISKNKMHVAEISGPEVYNISDYENPERKMQLTEIENTINSCVNRLSPQCVMVFKLIKEEGFSYKKVSGIMEISQNTIETHMRIALKKIKSALSQYLTENK